MIWSWATCARRRAVEVRDAWGCVDAGRMDLAADTAGVAASDGVVDSAVGAVPGVIGFAASQVAGVSDSAESDTPATCDAANPITPGTAPTAESTTPSDAATPAVSAAKSMRPASTQPHASRTSTARRRAHVAHDQIIQRHTEHVAKHQQLVTNVAFHATILRLHCDSQPNFATQPTVARREVGFTGLLRQ